MAKLTFPEEFLWGAATASHQVEGGTKNDWSEWEKENAPRLALKATTYYQEWQRKKFPEMLTPENYISGKAADHWNRYEEDFDILKSLHLNTYRLSLEWSRIEPEEGKFDTVAIEHYRKILQALRDRDIEPFVTLWHWTLPLWVARDGGWENRKTVSRFIRYAGRIIHEYGDLIHFWMPLNEPGTFVGMSYIQGDFPPQKRLAFFAANKVFKNLMRAYREAYQLIHAHQPKAMVGMSHYAAYMMPHRNTLLNWLIVKPLDYLRNWRFLDSINATNDFIGIQFYHTDTIQVKPLFNGRWGFIDVKNSNTWVTDMGWDVYPEGMYHLLKRAGKYRKPIYVTENGLADRFDEQRERFIREMLTQVHRALQEDVDVRGYFHWSLLDNFEWDKGFWPRFGLVEVDRETLERRVRPSARMYAEICRTNTLEVN